MPLDDVGFVIAFGALFAGGLVKGIIGIGLPLVAVPFLAHLMPVPTALAVMAFPIIIGNFQQMRLSGTTWMSVRRFWPLMLMLVLGIVLGARLLSTMIDATLLWLVGSIIVVFALTSLFDFRLRIEHRHERVIGPVLGFASGILGGVSSFYGPPIVFYVMSLRLSSDAFVSAMAVIYFSGTIPLYGSFAYFDILGWTEAFLSALGVIPVLLGMAVGNRMRGRLNPDTFRRLVFGVLVVVGLSMIQRGLT